jgi:anti-sigma B factor antagonist
MVGEAAILAINGDIDLHNSPELRVAVLSLLAKSNPKKIIMDLSNVPYMDSSAVAVLVEALQGIRRKGGKLVLSALQPRARGLLEISRLDTLFTLATDEADALAK